MKIDPKIQATGELQSEALKGAKKGQGRGAPARVEGGGGSSGDTIQISSQHGQVRQLAEQAAKLPDVRGEKVAPLKASVEKRSYHPDSSKVADAMLKEHSAKRTKA